MSKNTIKQISFVFATVILLIIGFIYNAYFPFLIISLYFSFGIVQKISNKQIFNSFIFRFVVSIFVYAIALEVISTASWLISHNASLMLSSVTTTVALGLLWYFIKDNGGTEPKISKSNLPDIFTIIACSIVALVFVILPLKNAEFNRPGSILVLVNNSVDDASHVGLLNDRLQFDRGVILGSDAYGQTRSEGIASYPAGWHSANAVIIKSFYSNITTGTESIVAYAITKVFWFLLLVFIYIRSIFSLYTIYSKKNSDYAVAISISSLSLLFVFWMLGDTFAHGFYSYLPQLISVPLLLLALFQINLLRDKSTASDIHKSMVLPVLICISTALSWLLLFPVFLFAILSMVSVKVAQMKKPWEYVRKIFKIPIIYIVFYLTLLAALLVQLYTSTGSNGDVTFIQGILLGGGIVIYPITLYTFIFIGCALFVYLCIKNNAQKMITPLLCYIFSAVLFISLLYLIQQYYTQHNSYYYFKSLNALTIALSMLCVVGISILIGQIKDKAGTLMAMVSTFILFSFSLQFAYVNPPFFAYSKGIRSTSNNTNEQIWNILQNNETQQNYMNNSVTLYYPDENPVLNEVGSMLIKSNKPFSGCFYATKSSSFKISPKDFSEDVIIKNCTNTQHVTYYVNKDSFERVDQILKNSGLDDSTSVNLISN